MKSLATISFVLGAVCAVALLAPGSAEAQTRPRGAPRVIQLDEIRIEGRVQKPNAFYILNRSSIGYEVLDLRTSFTREILRTVQDEPF
ncbi:MAG: hypothetical protein J0L92_21215 [Deltaproteobacteria bacterium]|nr:hypothetical protein [Deltaproteobacteria bacterium]